MQSSGDSTCSVEPQLCSSALQEVYLDVLVLISPSFDQHIDRAVFFFRSSLFVAVKQMLTHDISVHLVSFHNVSFQVARSIAFGRSRFLFSSERFAFLGVFHALYMTKPAGVCLSDHGLQHVLSRGVPYSFVST